MSMTLLHHHIILLGSEGPAGTTRADVRWGRGGAATTARSTAWLHGRGGQRRRGGWRRRGRRQSRGGGDSEVVGGWRTAAMHFTKSRSARATWYGRDAGICTFPKIAPKPAGARPRMSAHPLHARTRPTGILKLYSSNQLIPVFIAIIKSCESFSKKMWGVLSGWEKTGVYII